MSEDEGKKEIRPVISKLTESLMLIAISDLGRPTNKELSEYLGFKPAQTSMYLKKLEDYEFIKVHRNSMGSYDQRSIKVELTTIGHAQAWLAKASVHILPGEDELAVGIVNAIKKLMGKK